MINDPTPMPTQANDFDTLAAPHRRALLAHCYRMLGSWTEAEDAMQESMMRAWQAHPPFEGRAALRTWLYRIATNACLTLLQRHPRRSVPEFIGPAARLDTGMARALDDAERLRLRHAWHVARRGK
ncbi:MAG: sigma-70 family RNA polymerase sigma factor [Betaproteobacteria bacterium]|nr:sigma-70 family RNA polymerase sigma factor [Betaproteobacteria bacterium]